MSVDAAKASISSDFEEAVLSALRQDRPTIPARYLYDRRGSELFEAITRLDEYYPTRTEIGLIEAHAHEIATRIGPGRVVVEFGSGSSAKTPPFLRAVAASAYVPIDISADFLATSAAEVGDKVGIAVHPVAADFTKPIELPAVVRDVPKLGFFPGSTIGNMSPAEAVDLLRAFRETLGSDAHLVIGVDIKKSADILEPAYDDAKGVTAEFILGILRRMTEELLFPVKIVGAPTSREEDGLARSSRNGFLSESERKLAPQLYANLQQIQQAVEAGERDYRSLEARFSDALNEAGFAVDYLTISNARSLAPAAENDTDLVIAVAAKLGQTRLIDNVSLAVVDNQ